MTVKIPVGSKIAGAALTSDGKYLAVATIQPPKVVLIDTKTDKVISRNSAARRSPHDRRGSNQAAVLLPASSRSQRCSPASTFPMEPSPASHPSVPPPWLHSNTAKTPKRFSSPRRTHADHLVQLQKRRGSRAPAGTDSPRAVLRHWRRGQVFVTSADHEPQLVIFSPYQNQIDQTLYAGHALFGIAVAPNQNLLFLTNPDSGDVTILNIETRRPAASIRTGGNPRQVLIAPSTGPEEYAFAVDAETGDVSVIHIPAVLHKRGDPFIAEPPKPVFAVFRGGADPQSAVIIPYST